MPKYQQAISRVLENFLLEIITKYQTMVCKGMCFRYAAKKSRVWQECTICQDKSAVHCVVFF